MTGTPIGHIYTDGSTAHQTAAALQAGAGTNSADPEPSRHTPQLSRFITTRSDNNAQ